MASDDIRRDLGQAHDGRYLVRVRAINRSGYTVDVVGYVTTMREDGGIRLHSGDPEGGLVHEFPPSGILGVERVHGS